MSEPLPSAAEAEREPAPPSNLIAAAEDLVDTMAEVRRHVGEMIFGQRRVLDEIRITLLSGGHVLLVGVPGLAKTRLTEILGTVLGLSERRVQFTPDLMPADILGSEVLAPLLSSLDDEQVLRHSRLYSVATSCVVV